MSCCCVIQNKIVPLRRKNGQKWLFFSEKADKTLLFFLEKADKYARSPKNRWAIVDGQRTIVDNINFLKLWIRSRKTL